MSVPFSVRLLLDGIALGLLLVALAYDWLGNTAHEIIGTMMFGLLVSHTVFNRRWYGTVAQRTRAPRTILSRVINLSLLATMLALSVTSMLISREVFSALPLTSTFTARQIHSLVGYLALIIAAVHLGLHWTMIMGVVRRSLGISVQSKTAGICLQWLAAALAAVGVYSLFALNVGSKLLMQPTLEFWDFEAAAPAFFGHLLGIVFCSAFVSHHLSKLAGAFVARRS